MNDDGGNGDLPVQVVEGTEQDVLAAKQIGILAAKKAAIEQSGLSDFYKLRKTWSGWIIGWITLLVLFHCVLAVLVGRDILDFDNLQWFITAVTVETFLQVVGMGFVAVKFLFSHPKTEENA